jgi:16S rRNA (uracil1498-N3)-methyltransferase
MSVPRFFVDSQLRSTAEFALPAQAARHVRVLRQQPGDAVCLFDGRGGQWQGEILRIGRAEVWVHVVKHEAVERELDRCVTVALGMPANERMDTLVEKATELGAGTIQPLACARSVMRLAGERAQRKAAHWHAIAAAACEQCGRNLLPAVASPKSLGEWLIALAESTPADSELRLLLSLQPGSAPLLRCAGLARAARVLILSGPEGGLSDSEQALAVRAGFRPVSLGPRVLRADTAPLAALACIAALEGPA